MDNFFDEFDKIDAENVFEEQEPAFQQEFDFGAEPFEMTGPTPFLSEESDYYRQSDDYFQESSTTDDSQIEFDFNKEN